MSEPAEDAAVAAMRELVLATEAYRQATAGRLGLTSTESQAVSYLLARGPLGQNDLAAALGLTSGSVTPLVDRLERHGIAKRQPHPTDRRRSIVSLSAQQGELLDDINDWLLAAFSDFDPHELPKVAQTLRVLARGLRERASRP